MEGLILALLVSVWGVVLLHELDRALWVDSLQHRPPGGWPPLPRGVPRPPPPPRVR